MDLTTIVKLKREFKNISVNHILCLLYLSEGGGKSYSQISRGTGINRKLIPSVTGHKMFSKTYGKTITVNADSKALKTLKAQKRGDYEYTASSIKILTPEEITGFDWHLAEELSRKHKLPIEWVKRGFEACRRLDLNPDLFVGKYITKNGAELPCEFAETFKDIIDESKIDAERDRNQLRRY